MIIQLKHSGNTGNTPVVLANGELAINYTDQKLYYKHANGSILVLADGNTIGIDAYARLRANGAFDQANLAAIIAQSAYDTANGAFITANGAYITANAAYGKANGAVQTGFPTINIAGQSDVVADSNNDTLTLVAGSGIVLTTDAPNDTITITATGSTNTFSTLSVAGQNNVVADSNTDTVTLVAGESILITTDAANDTITFAVTTLDGGTF